MRKFIIICFSSALLPCICIAMEEPISEGCYHRHHKTTFSQNPSNFISKTPEEITPAEENFLLGLKFFKEEKFNESIKCFNKAAENDNDNAEYNLGVIYEHGVSAEIPRNLDQSEFWYRRAKDHGHIKAKEALDRVIKEKENKGWGISFPFW